MEVKVSARYVELVFSVMAESFFLVLESIKMALYGRASHCIAIILLTTNSLGLVIVRIPEPALTLYPY